MFFALVLLLGTGIGTIPVYAATGNVYTSNMTACYRHPVTGVIEDGGGESSAATGQGMVESCVGKTGIMEVTESGAYYMTLRLSLMDFTSNHSFWVQNVGDSSWSSPSEIGITGTGTDGNGTTKDVCMKVPSENCIVRISMHVDPMGRDVVFYVYPGNYSAGNSTDMNATIVTAAPGTGGADRTEGTGNTADNSGSDNGSDNTGDSGSGTGGGNASASNSGVISGGSSLSGGNLSGGSQSQSSQSGSEQSTTGATEADMLESSIITPATSDLSKVGEETTLQRAQGLSLSTGTADDTGADEQSDAGGSQIVQIAIAVVVTGVILIAVVSGVVYVFHKNWRRWGGAEDDME